MYVRFTCRGKLGRTVAVLLHTDLVDGISSIEDENPFLFGLPGKVKYGRYKHLGACGLFRKFAKACGADRPELLRGTLFRNNVFNFSADEVSALSTY